MAGVQLALSIAFAGAFWLLLFLGAALFNIIGLSFLGDLIEQGWFALPLTGLAFATAVHLTDVRDGLIRGVRTIALMLLSWLLLVLTVLVGGFLAALPFTGLDGLWETGSATRPCPRRRRSPDHPHQRRLSGRPRRQPAAAPSCASPSASPRSC